MNKKIAILTTSDIQTFRFRGVSTPWHGDKFKNETPKWEDAKHQVYSRGRLERAIAEGYEVYVVTSRSKLEECDKWWMSLVYESHIILAPATNGRDPRAIKVWQDFYTRLGEDWTLIPEFAQDHWPSYERELAILGYKLGYEFMEEED